MRVCFIMGIFCNVFSPLTSSLSIVADCRVGEEWWWSCV